MIAREGGDTLGKCYRRGQLFNVAVPPSAYLVVKYLDGVTISLGCSFKFLGNVFSKPWFKQK